MERVFGAIDLGASGGRVAAGRISNGRCDLSVVHRFPNAPVLRAGRVRWDVERIFSEVLVGLHRLNEQFPSVESIGIDGWGVDVALLDAEGDLVADPISYRDSRSASFVDEVYAVISPRELFAVNGLQFLPFTTLFQLAAACSESSWNRVAHVVLLPDLVGYWLTGRLGTEVTNASTTGLLQAKTGTWSDRIFSALGLDAGLFPPLRFPGEMLGPITDLVASRTGLRGSVEVTTVASHDTASAVVAVPTVTPEFVYVSSGTWSLVGTEMERPVLTSGVMATNFTNERGIDGRIRLLRNVGGLWLLQECLRVWAKDGQEIDLSRLLDSAADLSSGPVINVDDPDFVGPGDMPGRIAAAVAMAGHPPLPTQPAVVRCILDSLAAAYAATAETVATLTGHDVGVVHIVGGGSRNGLLCQLTADALGKQVLAGPAEATALGNVLVQARARGVLPQDLAALRRELACHEDLVRYRPRTTRPRSHQA